MGPDEEDLSIDYELAEQQRARLAADGKDALDKGIKACEDWAAQQTTARWGVEPGAQRFRRAYQNFILTLADELRKNAAELDEFTTRLQQALKDFAHNEEQLQQAITQITTDL
ncbi:hypothetical protein, partial [Buchananella hordeovulneris]|uniref:hypothetical protein n=1 Tax=Buchananella hordeovulneris TaxID=52770 RepID=UPI000FBF0D65